MRSVLQGYGRASSISRGQQHDEFPRLIAEEVGLCVQPAFGPKQARSRPLSSILRSRGFAPVQKMGVTGLPRPASGAQLTRVGEQSSPMQPHRT